MNPCHGGHQTLFLTSGTATSSDIVTDVMRAEKSGEEEKNRFIRDKLEKKGHCFDPVKHKRLKSMRDSKKTVKLTTSKNEVNISSKATISSSY